MKVLLITPKEEFPTGGIATWTNNYLSYAINNGLDCDIVNTVLVGDRAKNSSAKRNVLDEYKRTKNIFKQLNGFLKNNNYNVAHLNTSCGLFGIIRDYFIAKKIKKRNIKVVTQYHCDIPNFITNKISKWFLKKLAKLSDVNFVLCQNSANFLLNQCQAQSVIIPNFINDDYIINEDKPISPSIQNVFFVGRISKAKGMVELYSVANKFPNVNFVLAGVISEEMLNVEKPKNVITLGAVNRELVSKYLDEADVFLFPSYSEGFSMALLEAMARGVPSIATNVGANADMLEDKGGCVVEVKNVELIVSAMETLSSYDKRKEASSWCVSKVKNNYTLTKVMAKICAKYNELI